MQQEINLDDNGVLFITGVDLLVEPKTPYYIVEKTAPEGYIKLETPVPMTLEIDNSYTTVPVNTWEESTDSKTRPSDGLYNWSQTAKLWLDITGLDIIRTTGAYDPEDPATVLTEEEIIATSDNDTMYYRWPNKPSTVDIIIHKVNDKNEPLPGAVFKLLNGETIVEISSEGTGVVVEPKVEGQAVTIENSTFTIPEGGVTIRNLRASEDMYSIVEVSSPRGYVITNKTPATFKVDAGSIAESHVEGVIYTSDTKDFTIPNTPGARLPATGGPGTTIFYVTGIGLIALAVLLLLRKREKETL